MRSGPLATLIVHLLFPAQNNLILKRINYQEMYISEHKTFRYIIASAR